MNINSFNNIEFCQKNKNNTNKRCVNFYKHIQDNYDSFCNQVIKCPYKYFVHIKSDMILRSLIFSDDIDYKKIVDRFKFSPHSNEKIEKYQVLTSVIYNEQLVLEDILSVFEYTLHDLRNHFSYLINTLDYAISSDYITSKNKKYLEKIKNQIVKTRNSYLVGLNKEYYIVRDSKVTEKLRDYVKINKNLYILSLVEKYEDYYSRLLEIEEDFNVYESKLSKNIESNHMKEREISSFTSISSCVEFVNYRIRMHKKYLNILSNESNLPTSWHKHNIQKILYKIKSIMRGKMDKKDMQINLPQDFTFKYTLINDVYLALFVIIENAITYSPMRKDIYIDFSYANKSDCIVKISNVGPCTGMEDITKLFEKGVRGENSPFKHSQGKGLGLSLVKSILDDNKLKYNISSKPIPLSDYCTFCFSITFTNGETI